MRALKELWKKIPLLCREGVVMFPRHCRVFISWEISQWSYLALSSWVQIANTLRKKWSQPKSKRSTVRALVGSWFSLSALTKILIKYFDFFRKDERNPPNVSLTRLDFVPIPSMGESTSARGFGRFFPRSFAPSRYRISLAQINWAVNGAQNWSELSFQHFPKASSVLSSAKIWFSF